MFASVYLVDGGAQATLRALLRGPLPRGVAGLRGASALVAAPLTEAARPQLGRRGVLAFWADEGALDAFEATHPAAPALTGGWHARLEPVRAVPVAGGHFPGVPGDLPTGLVVDDGGPAVVVTIGKLRAGRAVPFLRASAKAERDVLDAPGVLWATGLADPLRRTVATLSLWSDVPRMRDYVTGTEGHSAAMRDQREDSFHNHGSFVRFRPASVAGSLSGRNPLPSSLAATLAARTD